MVSSSPTSNFWHQPCKCCIRHHHHQHQSRKPSQCHPMILNLAWSSVLHCASLYITHHHYSKSPKYKWTKPQFRFEGRPVYTLAETVVVQHNLCSFVVLLCSCVVLLYFCVVLLCCAVVLLCWSRGVSRLSSVPKAIQTEAAAILQQQLLSNRDKTAIKYLFIDIHIGAVHW